MLHSQSGGAAFRAANTQSRRNVCTAVFVTIAAVIISLVLASPVKAQFFDVSNILPINPAGQFTVSNDIIHYWVTPDAALETGAAQTGGYQQYNTSTGVNTVVNPRQPAGGVSTNTFGDSFGVFDSSSNTFVASTSFGSGFVTNSEIYSFSGSNWTLEADTSVASTPYNTFGGQAVGGTIYFSGTVSGSTFISRLDSQGRRDSLVSIGGFSAGLAVNAAGDIYYGTTGTGNDGVYRWSAADIQAAIDDLDTMADSFLDLSDGQRLFDLPAGGSGIAVDDDGNVIFTANDFAAFPDVGSTLGIWDNDTGEIFTLSLTGDGDALGSISAEGNVLAGDPFYVAWNDGTVRQAFLIPETSSGLLAACFLAAWFVRRRNRR